MVQNSPSWQGWCQPTRVVSSRTDVLCFVPLNTVPALCERARSCFLTFFPPYHSPTCLMFVHVIHMLHLDMLLQMECE